MPRRVPTREELVGSHVSMLKQGRSAKADLLRVDLGEGPFVVKDFGRKSAWVRLIGRLQIGREHRAYRWLGELAGVPRLVGRIDAHALAIEEIYGRPLGHSPDRYTRGAESFEQLARIVDAIHDRGMVHWDLRARKNVLIRPDGRITVLDFASAVWLRPGGPAHRLLFERMRVPDRSALLKWKELLDAGPPTPEEAEFLRRHRRWRRFWIFNPKGRGRQERS